MEKFSNKGEQAEWFLVAYKREDIKIADKVSVLVNRDCGDFKNFLYNNLLLVSETMYCICMKLYDNPDNLRKIVYEYSDGFKKVLKLYFNYQGGTLYEEDSLYKFELSTLTRNALLRHNLKTRRDVVSFIESNGKTSDCLWRKITNVGKTGAVNICKVLGIEEYIPSHASSVSDIKRFNDTKKYLKNGGTDIREVRKLMGVVIDE